MALSPEIRARFAQSLQACVAQRWGFRTRAWVLRELAQRCACSESAAANLLAARSNPSHPMLLSLAHALDVPPALLVPLEDQWQLHGSPRSCGVPNFHLEDYKSARRMLWTASDQVDHLFIRGSGTRERATEGAAQAQAQDMAGVGGYLQAG